MGTENLPTALFQKLDTLIYTSDPEKLYQALEAFFEELQLQHWSLEDQVRVLVTAAESAMHRNLSVAKQLIATALQQCSSDLPETLRAEIWHIAGIIEGKSGNLAAAFRYLTQGLRAAAPTEYAPLMTRIAISLSVVYLRSRNFDKALQTLDFADAVLEHYAPQFDEVESETLQVRIAGNRAVTYGEQGQLQKAIRVLLSIDFTHTLDPVSKAALWMNIGVYLESSSVPGNAECGCSRTLCPSSVRTPPPLRE